MKSSTGRWVSGDDFFDREKELALLESRVRDGNHMAMTGQRRMGKTSILQELGRRLELEGWVFLFADVEADRSEEDMIASLARAIHPVTPITSALPQGHRPQVPETGREGGPDHRASVCRPIPWRPGLRELAASRGEPDRPLRRTPTAGADGH